MDYKITKVDIVTSISKLDDLIDALNQIGVTELTVSNILGCGNQKCHKQYYRGVAVDLKLLPTIKIEMVICEVPLDKLIDTITSVLHTGNAGDGKIFVYDVSNVIDIRNGARGKDALK